MKKFWINLTPGIAWFFILLYLLCLPGEAMPTKDWLDKIYFDKIAHFSCFGLLTLMFFYPFLKPGHPTISASTALNWIVLLVIAWGLITEFIQYFFIPHRNFDPFDWVFDTLGALVARAFALWLLKRRAKVELNSGI